MLVMQNSDPGGTFGFLELPKCTVCNDLRGSVPRVIKTENGNEILKFRISANDIYGSRKSAIFDCEVSDPNLCKTSKKWIIPSTKCMVRGRLKTYVKSYNEGGSEVVGFIKVSDFIRTDIGPRKAKEM